MANLFGLPWRPVYDNQVGLGVPGAQLWFTAIDANTERTVYTDEALTIPHENPVICDGVGNPPIIYTDEAQTYRCRCYAPDAEAGVAAPIFDLNPWVPGLFADAAALEPVADAAAESAAAASEAAALAAAAAVSADSTATELNELALTIEAMMPEGFAVADLAAGIPVNPLWFGASPGNDGADNDTAFAAMFAFLKSDLTEDYGYTDGSLRVRIPAGIYDLDTTLDIDFQVIIEGDGGSHGGGTVLRWPAGQTGLRFQASNTSGATAATGSGTAASGSVIRDIALIGGYTATEGEYHGVHMRAPVWLQNVLIEDFQGDGVHIAASAGTGVPLEGNANGWRMDYCLVQNCRTGRYVDGTDANAGMDYGSSYISNRQWGVWDSSFLGNTSVALHAAANGWDGALGSTPTASTLSSKRYYVKPGQASGASTNSPSGTTADNTWWGYIGAGGTYNGVVAWVSGTTFREGGSYKTDDANQTGGFIFCYAEDDQNPPQIVGSNAIIGGNIANTNRGAATALMPGSGGSVAFGSQRGGARDSDFYLDNSSLTSVLNFRRWDSAGLVGVDAKLFTVSTTLYYDATQHKFRIAGVDKATFDGNWNLVTGQTYKINSVQVVAARKTGWTVATGTATRTAFDTASVTLPQLAERVKALIDDLHGTAGHGLIGT